MRAIVFGGSGQMGRAAARALLGAGWDVAIVTRGGRGLPPGVQGARVIADAGQGRDALIGDGADAVFEPLAMHAADAAGLLAARGRVGRFVAISSAAVYQDARGRSLATQEQGFPQFDRPITEDQSTAAPGPGYAGSKISLEAALLASGAPVTILRPGAIHGAGARHPREWVIVKRMLDGRSVMPVACAGASRFGTTAADAIGALVETCLRQRAQGVFNVADADAPSVAQIAAAIGTILGRTLTLIPVGELPDDLGHVGQTPWSVPLPMVMDTARARALGWQPLPHAMAVRPAVQALLALDQPWQTAFPMFGHYGFDPFDDASEDRALALVQG